MSADRNIIAELAIDARKLMLYHATTTVPDAVVQTRFHAAIDEDVPYLFYAVQTDDVEAFDEALTADDSVTEPLVISDSPSERLYRVCPTPTEMLVPEVTRLGGALCQATCRNGIWSTKLQLSEVDSLTELREYCRQRDIGFELRRLYHADTEGSSWETDGLTSPQREALVAAFERGYFAEPRTSSLEELAEVLGISPTAVGGRLRRGTARLVERALIENA